METKYCQVLLMPIRTVGHKDYKIHLFITKAKNYDKFGVLAIFHIWCVICCSRNSKLLFCFFFKKPLTILFCVSKHWKWSIQVHSYGCFVLILLYILYIVFTLTNTVGHHSCIHLLVYVITALLLQYSYPCLVFT